jgi:reactive intermediate/imine deaminase
MPKSIISSSRIAPRPGAAYSAGTKAGNLVFTGTMGPFNKQAELVGCGDIRAQTRQVLENVKAVIESGGGNLSDVMKTTVYITDIAHFAPMNEVYRTFFASEPPARSPVIVNHVIDGVLVEIDAIAVIG